MPFTSQEIQNFRADTPACHQLIHLNNAGAALMPQKVLEAMIAHLHLENEIGGYEAAAKMAEISTGFYEALGQLLNCPARNIAYLSSATDAYNRALTSIDFAPDDYILTSTDDYVSNQIAFLQLRDRFGVKVARAEDLPEGGIDLDDLVKKMDTLQPKVVALTHIPTNSGLIQPAAAVGRLCHDRDILYLLDACQSAGQLPLDVDQLHCDFLSATFRKFLRGPRGAGFLYVSDRILKGNYSPLVLDLHSARWTDIDQFRPESDAKRFELWERAHALFIGSKIATEYAHHIGLDRIAQRVQQLSQYGRQKLAEIPNLRILDTGQQLGGIITFTTPKVHEEQLKKQLQDAGINSSVTYGDYARIDFARKAAPRALRLSPHYYNTIEEMDQTVSILANILKN